MAHEMKGAREDGDEGEMEEKVGEEDCSPTAHLLGAPNGMKWKEGR
jgi:hypothetical protein